MKHQNAGPLGQTSEYPEQYDPSVLHPIPREIGRAEIQLNAQSLPFYGNDIWNAYELSWLNAKGKPVVALMKMVVNAQSKNIVESKSLKLYLGSFNGSRFDSLEQVQGTIRKDVAECVDGEVEVTLLPLSQPNDFALAALPGLSLDDLDIAMDQFVVSADLLNIRSQSPVEETLHSHLMRSCCPVTGQPDWASIVIRYHGPQICHESMLRYIVSYRNNQEFHEQCVERVYMDILQQCQPDSLMVYARYTRRGGIDINPYRCTEQTEVGNLRLIRQ